MRAKGALTSFFSSLLGSLEIWGWNVFSSRDCFAPRRGSASPVAQEKHLWWLGPRYPFADDGLLLERAYIYINSTWGDARVRTPLQLHLISMETFAVLKVLFVFLSGALCSAPSSLSFLHSTFSYFFPINFPTPLSCPSFYLLSVSSHSLNLSFCLLPWFAVLQLWFSISLYQLLSSAQSPSLLLSLFTVPSLPWCRSLSAAAASLVAWSTADLSTQEPEIPVWCKRHLKTLMFHLWQQTLQLPLETCHSGSLKLSPEGSI